MKVLDPQSALLTNAEVYQFLKAKPINPPDPQQGAYPITNLKGYQTVTKDFNSYAEEITPFVKDFSNVDTFITDLVTKLKPYELAKTEVVNLLNVGVGTRSTTSPQTQVNGDAADGEERDEEAELARDIQFFKVVVEEADERFPDEAGDERIAEIIAIIRSCVRGQVS